VAGRKVASPKAKDRRNRGEEVLEAAVEVFHEKGYATASIQDVADRVGVLKGSLYHYIDSKEDLLARVFQHSNEQSFALMESIGALEIPAIDRLRQFAQLWILWYLENIERVSLYFNEWRYLTGERLAEAKTKSRDYEHFVAGLLEEVKQEGDADPSLDVRYGSLFILAAINGLPGWYRRRGSDSAVHISWVYTDMVVGAVCSPVASTGPGN
jgi:AcrR family transcriptional regulator